MRLKKHLCIFMVIAFLWTPMAWASEAPRLGWVGNVWSTLTESIQVLAANVAGMFRAGLEASNTEEDGDSEVDDSTTWEEEPAPPTVMIGGGIQPIG